MYFKQIWKMYKGTIKFYNVFKLLQPENHSKISANEAQCPMFSAPFEERGKLVIVNSRRE